jgi:signal transduction histidine kinase
MPDQLRRRWLRIRGDRAIAAALYATCVAELIASSGTTKAPLAVVEAAILCAPLLMMRSRPVAAVLVAAAAAVIGPVVDGSPDFAGQLVACSLTYVCGLRAAARTGAVAVGMLIGATQVSMGFSEFPNVEILFSTVGPYWLGHQVRLRNSLVAQLGERTRELHDEHDAFARLSVRHERARIARELHDIVAHHLAVIVVQAGAGRMVSLAPSQRTPERFATIREAGAHALVEMARLVDILQSDDASTPGTASRWRLLTEEASAGGVEVCFNWSAPDLRLPADVERDAYLIVREALTNAIKHAPGAHVRVDLEADQGELEIEVRDDGPRDPMPLAHTGSRLGLIGMHERIDAAGGTLEAGPDPAGGWRLRATLPIASPAVTLAR